MDLPAAPSVLSQKSEHGIHGFTSSRAFETEPHTVFKTGIWTSTIKFSEFQLHISTRPIVCETQMEDKLKDKFGIEITPSLKSAVPNPLHMRVWRLR